MVAFREWLFSEERKIIDQSVLDGYEREFQRRLGVLIGRTRDPMLKSTFERMRTCPIKDTTGRCYTFTGWITNSLMRHNCYQRVDAEAALNYVAFRLLSPVSEHGQSRKSAFDFDEARPWEHGTNPLEARLKTYIVRDIRNICGMRMPKLWQTNRRKGSLTITSHHGKGTPTPGTVAADEIPAPRSSHEKELMSDIVDLLRRKSAPSMPLLDIFQAMLEGIPLKVQRKRFGHATADRGRKIIKDVVRQYAIKTQNHELLRLLDTPPAKRPKRETSAPKPKLPPDVQDYMSVIDVIEKNGGAASMAMLGKKRRRWLERKPRNPNSLHKTRLHDVLARMGEDGVLVKRGALYVQGPNFQQFKDKAATSAASRA